MRTIMSLIFFVTITAIAAAQPTDPVKPKAPVKPLPCKVTPAQPKAGKLVFVTTDAENPLYDFDGVFAADEARQTGKELAIALPMNKEDKTYLVRCIYTFEGKIVIEKVIVKVVGSDPNIPPLPPGDTLKQLRLDMMTALGKIDATLAKLDARLALLEQIKPIPPPIDPFIQSLQGSYNADNRPADKLAKLIAIYKASAATVNDPTNKTPADVFKVMHTAIASVLGEPDPKVLTVIPNTRKAIGAELDKVLPLGPASVVAMDAAMRATINAQFARVQKSLEGVNP